MTLCAGHIFSQIFLHARQRGDACTLLYMWQGWVWYLHAACDQAVRRWKDDVASDEGKRICHFFWSSHMMCLFVVSQDRCLCRCMWQWNVQKNLATFRKTTIFELFRLRDEQGNIVGDDVLRAALEGGEGWGHLYLCRSRGVCFKNGGLLWCGVVGRGYLVILNKWT